VVGYLGFPLGKSVVLLANITAKITLFLTNFVYHDWFLIFLSSHCTS
jgi:hypothetical protein